MQQLLYCPSGCVQAFPRAAVSVMWPPCGAAKVHHQPAAGEMIGNLQVWVLQKRRS